MKQKARLAVYAALGAALLIALIAAPGVWATPGQSSHAQTVPTRTPVSDPGGPVNTPVTPDPGADQPDPTRTPDPGTPQPAATVVPPTATKTAKSALGPPLELPVTGGRIQP